MTWPRCGGNSTGCGPTTRKITVAVHVARPDAPLAFPRPVVFLICPREVQLTIAIALWIALYWTHKSIRPGRLTRRDPYK